MWRVGRAKNINKHQTPSNNEKETKKPEKIKLRGGTQEPHWKISKKKKTIIFLTPLRIKNSKTKESESWTKN